MRHRYVPQRGINLDYLMWLFTRISGLGIVFLALIGLGVSHVYGGSIADGPADGITLDVLPQSQPRRQQQCPRCHLGMG